MSVATKPKPKTKRGPRGPYKKRTMKMSDTVPLETPEKPEGHAQFLDTLTGELELRDAQIKDRLTQIEQESDALEVEEAALKQEQERVQAGLNALAK